jgi:hypothetical protein
MQDHVSDDKHEEVTMNGTLVALRGTADVVTGAVSATQLADPALGWVR